MSPFKLSPHGFLIPPKLIPQVFEELLGLFEVRVRNGLKFQITHRVIILFFSFFEMDLTLVGDTEVRVLGLVELRFGFVVPTETTKVNEPIIG